MQNQSEMQDLPNLEPTEAQMATGVGKWKVLKSKVAGFPNYAKSNWLTILTVVFCVSDVILDGWNGTNMILGTNYTKTVSNMTVEYENCTLIEKCTTYGRETYVSNTNESETTYTISCFEKDPLWGTATLFLMFFPGGIICPDIEEMTDLVYGPKPTFTQLNRMLSIRILLVPLYPLVLLTTFVLSLCIHTPRMKRWVLSATQSEGTWEASLQLSLQLYIILSLSNRSPSPIQILSLSTTILSANKSCIEIYLHSVNNALRTADHQTTEANLLEGKSAVDNIKLIAKYLPVFVTVAFHRVGSLTIVCVLLKYAAIWYYLCIFVVIVVFCLILKAYPAIKSATSFVFPIYANCITMTRVTAITRNENKPFLLFTFVFYFLVNTLTIILLTIAVESGWWRMGHWDQLAFIQNKSMFRGTIGTVLGCGILSWPLFICQIFMKEEEDQVEDEQLAVGEE